MSSIISDYQKWKQQGENLRIQAKTAMEVRYRELFLEAIQIAEEYKEDFGASLKLPPAVTSFRYKAGAKGKKAKPAVKQKAGSVVAKAAPVAAAKPDPKLAALNKKLDTARKKLDAAKAAGTPTKNLEDRIYEIEDDIRLIGQPA
ncbi:MAG: hypothetical protein HY820_09255 [Acidobacteria bacterium]|nr:hypothetical protein [Acidobacteriota bacterium]